MSVEHTGLSEDEKDVRRVVKHATNQVYNPTVSSAEVAEELSLSVEEAYELLLAVSETGYLKTKPVAGTDPDDPRNHLWW